MLKAGEKVFPLHEYTKEELRNAPLLLLHSTGNCPDISVEDRGTEHKMEPFCSIYGLNVKKAVSPRDLVYLEEFHYVIISEMARIF